MRSVLVFVAACIAIVRAQQSGLESLLAKYPPGSQLPLVKFEDQNSYFFEHEIKLNWYQAAEFCRSYNMQLVSVESVEENDFIVSQIEPQNHPIINGYWTSGNDLGRNASYVWSGTGLRFDSYYSNWHQHEPSHFYNGREEHCIMYFNYPGLEWKWNDGVCSDGYYFVCEMRNDAACGSGFISQ